MLQQGNLPVYFIRHNWSGTGIAELNNGFFDRREIAIHFDDFGLDESRYDRGGKTALANMKLANASEALIVAAYRFVDQKILIGRSAPASLRCEHRLVTPDLPTREYKILKLQDEIAIELHDFSLPFLLQPPFSTMVHWEMGERAVNAFYRNAKADRPTERPIDPAFFTGWHWEVLAEEWLRQHGHLKHKLFQLGKFMKDFDIVGVGAHGKPIFVQVKFDGSEKDFKRFCGQVGSKSADRAAFYVDDQKNIEKFRISKPDWITLVSIQTIYAHFLKENPEFLRSLLYGFRAAGSA